MFSSFLFAGLLVGLRAGVELGSGDEVDSPHIDGTFAKSFSSRATALREHLLSTYDKSVPPPSNRTNSYSQAGVDVAMQLRFFKVESVLAADGRMTLKVWMRLAWTDERLSWNASEWGVTQLHFSAASLPAGAEVAEVWVPDVQPYNAYTGIQHTLDPAVAIVQSNGAVFFSRPGMLDVMCKFSGLAAFPYDSLKCGVEFGGWGYSGGYQGLQLLDGGYSFSSQEDTAGSSYQEYSIAAVQCGLENFFYECCANEPWPIIKYIVTLNRADYYYTLFFVLPGIMITALSFAVFYVEPEACDALAYSITVVLANEVSKIVLVGSIPVCGEVLWTECFSLTNTVFCVVALFESVLQVIVSNNTTESFLPEWSRYLLAPLVLAARSLCARLRAWRHKAARLGNLSRRPECPPYPDAVRDGPPEGAVRIDKFKSVASHLTRKLPRESSSQEGGGSGCSFPARSGSHAKQGRCSSSSSGFGGARSETLAIDKMQKLVFFEYLFFMMDENSDGILSVSYCKERVAFLALEHSDADIDRILKAADKDSNGQLSRLEFCELCVECLMGYPIELLRAANENFVLAASQERRRNVAYWRAIGSRMDGWFGLVIPWTYVVTLAVLFNLTMSDEYEAKGEGGAVADMYAGMGPTSLRGLYKYQAPPLLAVFRTLSPLLVGLALFLASVTYGYAKRERNRRARAAAAKSNGRQPTDLGPSLFRSFRRSSALVQHRGPSPRGPSLAHSTSNEGNGHHVSDSGSVTSGGRFPGPRGSSYHSSGQALSSGASLDDLFEGDAPPATHDWAGVSHGDDQARGSMSL